MPAARVAPVLAAALLAGCAVVDAPQHAPADSCAVGHSVAAPAPRSSGLAGAPEIATGYAPKPLVRASSYVAVTAHPHATQAACRVLARGGSAVDAAIAAQWVLAVVEPQSSGLGGGGLLLHWHAARRAVTAWDGRETAPAPAASRPDDLRWIDADERVPPRPTPRDSGRSVGVPGLVRLLAEAHRAHGRLPWHALLAPAIALADGGFDVTPAAGRLNRRVGRRAGARRARARRVLPPRRPRARRDAAHAGRRRCRRVLPRCDRARARRRRRRHARRHGHAGAHDARRPRRVPQRAPRAWWSTRRPARPTARPSAGWPRRCWPTWLRHGKPATVGADKAYDTRGFAKASRQIDVTPHVAQNLNRSGGSAVDGRTARHAGYAVSQRKRKCNEQCFGWGKVIGPIRQVKVRGLDKVDPLMTLTMAAYNLTRLRSVAQLRPHSAQ